MSEEPNSRSRSKPIMIGARTGSASFAVDIEGDFDPIQLGSAINHLEKAVALSPDHPRYRRVLAEAHLAARRFDRALTHLRQIDKLRPEPRTHYLMAYAYFALGDLDQAEALLAGLNDAGEVGFSRYHLLRGRILYERRRFADAMNEFSRALDVRPHAALPRWHMGRALVAHAQYVLTDAGNLYRRALQLLTSYLPTKSQLEEWHYLLGRVHLALHHPVEALEHLELARRHAGGSETYLLLGFAHLLRGRKKKAMELLAESTKSPEERARCRDYLCEVVSTPRNRLAAMGFPAEQSGLVDLVDEGFLERIFGRGSQEMQRVLEAAMSKKPFTLARTRAEDTRAPLASRLFASTTIEEAPSPPPVAPVVGETSGRGDRIFPKTHLDVTEALPLPEESGADPVTEGEERISRTETLDQDDIWDADLDVEFDPDRGEPER